MLIPLHRGGNWAVPGPVVAHAIVDGGDYEILKLHRWRLNPDGYAVRTSQRETPSACPECGWLPKPGVRVANGVSVHRAKMHGVPTEKRHTISMHRFLLGLQRGDPRQGDHINRNRIDNRRPNLRITPGGIQTQNQGAVFLFKGSPPESRHRGVYKVKKNGRWTGRWKAVAANHYLGSFTSEVEAAAVASAYRVKTMPYAVD